MKVKCILKDSTFGLTYDKIYTVIPKWKYKYPDKYYLKNDKGWETFYFKEWFIVVD